MTFEHSIKKLVSANESYLCPDKACLNVPSRRLHALLWTVFDISLGQRISRRFSQSGIWHIFGVKNY